MERDTFLDSFFFFPPQASLPPLQSLELGEELGPCLDNGPHSAASMKFLMEGASPPINCPRKTSFWVLGSDRTRDLRPAWYPESTPIFKEATGVYFHGFQKAMFRSLGLGPEHPGKSGLCWQLWRVG